jgi:hypothetical protein
MSNAEYLSRPFPFLAKFAAMLRNIAPLRTAFVRFVTLLRSSKNTDEPLVSAFLGEIPELADKIPEIIGEPPGAADEAAGTVDETPSLTETSDSLVIAPALSAEVALAPECGLPAREQLIRRRWAETGIKMWAGQAALNIQGSTELLPMKTGGTRREYDRLEFRLIAGDIVCEGVVVDPPLPRQ